MTITRLMRSKHIVVLFFIFFMLATLSSFLWLMSDSLKRNFNFTASEVLGADGSIESNQALPKEIDTLAKNYPIELSQTINFTSMVIAQNNSVLAHIRAVEKNFPLKGKVQIKNNQNKIINNAKLGIDEIWIDEALKTRLNININDKVQLGSHHFQIVGIILSEPARAGMSFVLAPKVIMRTEEVAKTGLIQPYSRVLYQLFISAQNTDFDAFTQKVKNQFTQLKVYSTREGRPFANSIFNLAERYIGIFIVLTVILSGLGMIILAKAYAAENILTIALLKTFGCSLTDIRKAYFYGFLVFGLTTIIMAIGLSVGGLVILQAAYPEYLAFDFAYIMSKDFVQIVLMQLATSLLILYGFAFIPIIQTLKISPLYLFRKEVAYQAAWPVYLCAMGTILLLLLLYIQNYLDVLMLFSYLLLSSVMLYFLFYLILGAIKLFPTTLNSTLIHSRKSENSLLVTQLSILFLLSGLLWAIFNDYFGGWLKSIPTDAPNQFMINITDNNKQGIIQFWEKEGIHLNLSPMLTARLKSVNDQTRTFHRALNISYMNTLPADNEIVAGQNWDKHLSGEQAISIEQNFAKNIQAKIGDVLAFDIGGQEIKGKIMNIRSLKWESFRPNFYVIFPDGVLNNFPKTYLTSIYLPENQLSKTTDFLKQFPAITLIDINLTLSQVTAVLNKVVTALKYIIAIIFVLVTLVYFALISITFFERQYESALLRSIGASKTRLKKLMLTEFGLMGALSGSFGVTGAIILALLLSKRLNITYVPSWEYIIYGAGLGALFTIIMGWLITYRVVNTSPMILLKES